MIHYSVKFSTMANHSDPDQMTHSAMSHQGRNELHVCPVLGQYDKGSLTLAMGKCLWFSVKIKVCQLSLSSP